MLLVFFGHFSFVFDMMFELRPFGDMAVNLTLFRQLLWELVSMRYD